MNPSDLRSTLERELGALELAAEIGAYGEPPSAPEPAPVDVAAIERQLWKESLGTVPPWKFGARRALRDQVRAEANERGIALQQERQANHAELQSRLDAQWAELQRLRQQIASEVDAWVSLETTKRAAAHRLAQGLRNIQWQRLEAGEPDATLAALRTAFEDAPVTPLGCVEATVVLVVAIPDRDELIGDQEPAYTEGGRPTVRKRTQTRMNDLYVGAMASRLLGAARRAATAAPGIEEIFVIGIVPVDDSEEWEPVYEGAFGRDYLLTRVPGIPNEVEPLTDALNDAEDAWWEVVGRTHELATINTDDDPGLAAVMSRMKRAVRAEGSAAEGGDAAAVRELLPSGDGSNQDRDSGAQTTFGNVSTSAENAEPITAPIAHRPQEEISRTDDGPGSDKPFRGPTAEDLTAPDNDPLVSALSDSDSDVRYEAINALRARRSPDLRDAFLKAVGDTNSYVRRVA
ncbi:MAG TPA: HEAT repeat domain-containing protein, partial [Solirubrobacteraceae bacterium]|nr:HEAT repeat domain-containing protein [Solirubrobacteraceae bacterium]